VSQRKVKEIRRISYLLHTLETFLALPHISRGRGRNFNLLAYPDYHSFSLSLKLLNPLGPPDPRLIAIDKETFSTTTFKDKSPRLAEETQPKSLETIQRQLATQLRAARDIWKEEAHS
jgi:hypothetical protein